MPREQAIWAVGMIRSPESFDVLITALGDTSADIRSQAAWALGMLRDSRAIDALSDALKDNDADVREQAAWRALTFEVRRRQVVKHHVNLKRKQFPHRKNSSFSICSLRGMQLVERSVPLLELAKLHANPRGATRSPFPIIAPLRHPPPPLGRRRSVGKSSRARPPCSLDGAHSRLATRSFARELARS